MVDRIDFVLHVKFCIYNFHNKKRPTLVRWSCNEKRGGICWHKSNTFL